MPPVVQITMIALNETSAARVCTKASPPMGITPPTGSTPASPVLFTTSSESQFAADLLTLETNLAALGLSYRVFTAMVPIRESKMQ